MPLQALAFHLLHRAKAWGSSVLIVTPSSEKRPFVNTLEFLSSGHRLLWNLHGAVGVFAALQRQKLECVQVARAGGQWSEMLSLVCVPWFQGISLNAITYQ